MTTPGGGGDRLDVPVVADATGFAKGLQAKIDAETKEIRARIKAEIDTARLQAQAAAAAKRTEKQTKVSLKVGVDARYLRESIRSALAGITGREYRVKVTADVDTSEAAARLAALNRTPAATVPGSASAGGEDARLTADQSAARTAQEALNRTREEATQRVRSYGDGVAAASLAEERALIAVARARQQLERVNSRPSSSGLDRREAQAQVRAAEEGLARVQSASNGVSKSTTRALSSLSRIGLMAGGVQMLTSAVTALGGGLFAMAGAASQAIGVLAALPNLAGIAAQGIAALFAGFSGISDAVSQMGKVQAGAGKAAAQSAKAQEQAQRRIADARARVTETVESGARRIVSAERAVADAQKARQRAQEALTRAVEDAKEKLADYQLQLKGAALDEEAAQLAVERARERRDETFRDPRSTGLDRKESDLALRQAEQALAEIQESNQDLQQEASQAAAAGVMGAANVVAAQEDVADANQGVADSEAELSQTRIDNTKDLADAQRDLAEAISDASDAAAAAAGGGGVDLLAQAMAKLSPVGRAFAEFIGKTMKPRLMELRNAVQDGLLPGVQDGLESLIKPGGWLDAVQVGLVDTGTRLGELARKGGELMSSPAFTKDTGTIMASNNRALTSFGNAGLSLVNVFRNLAVAAGPLVERFATFIEQKAGVLDTFVSANRESGKLATFFKNAGDRAAQLGRILGNVIATIFHMGQAGVETGDDLLDKLEKITAKWREWTGSDEGQSRMTKFFEDMGPLTEKFGELLSNVAELFVTMGENGGGSLGGLLDALNGIVEALTWVLQSPIGPFVSGVLALAGAAGGVGLVASGVMRTVDNLSKIGAGVKNVSDFASGLRGGADAAESLGSKAASAGEKVGTAASAVADFGKKAATSALDAGKAAGTHVASAAATSAAWIATGIKTAATWVAMAASATFNALVAGAAWVGQSIVAGATMVGTWVANAAVVAATWVGLAIAATVNAIRTGVVWLAQTALTTGGMILSWALAVATVVGGWVLMGVQSLINAARVAAAWLIAMGPIGLIIAAVIGLVALIIANWDTIKRVTKRLWDGLVDGLKPAVNAIIGLLNRIGVGAINLLIEGANHIPGVNIPKVPKIPLLAEGGIIRKPTLAVVGEDGDELVLPLEKPARRDALLAQAGITPSTAYDKPTGADGLGGWGTFDRASSGPSLAAQVAASPAAQAEPRQAVGTVIEEGAIQLNVSNPVGQTTEETLNERLHKLGSLGIFASKPGT